MALAIIAVNDVPLFGHVEWLKVVVYSIHLIGNLLFAVGQREC